MAGLWSRSLVCRSTVAEAQCLAEANIRFDKAYTSVLKRAIKTCNIALEEMDQVRAARAARAASPNCPPWRSPAQLPCLTRAARPARCTSPSRRTFA